MKIYMHYSIGIAMMALIALVPAIASAQDNGVSVSADTNISVTGTSRVITTGTSPTAGTSSIRQKLRAETQVKVRDVRISDKAERDSRNASTTERREVKSKTRAESQSVRIAAKSSLNMDAFRSHQMRLRKQLDLSVQNLTQIRARIIQRIEKSEASDRNMTEARAKLAIADAKLTVAKQAIATLVAYTPATNATSTASTTISVDLSRPRIIGSEAIEAVHDARRAFNDVVVTIAHSMGLKIGSDGVTGNASATTTATTTP